jgi:UDPglucose 6-dehydrogenase
VVRAHDPAAMPEAAKLLPGVKYCASPYEACEKADALILMTEWNEYRALDLARIKAMLKEPIFIDLRNVYPAELMKENGFRYHSVGRTTVE